MTHALPADRSAQRRLSTAVALSLALHALIVLTGRRAVEIPTIAPARSERPATLAVQIVRSAPDVAAAAAASPTLVVPALDMGPPAPPPSAQTRAASTPPAAPQPALPTAAAPAPPPPPPPVAQFVARAAIEVDRSEAPGGPLQRVLAGQPNAVRTDFVFYPPLALQYPLQRLERPGVVSNRVLIVADAQGVPSLAAVEIDDPDLVQELRVALSRTRVAPAPPGVPMRWMLLRLWIERVPFDPSSAFAQSGPVTPAMTMPGPLPPSAPPGPMPAGPSAPGAMMPGPPGAMPAPIPPRPPLNP